MIIPNDPITRRRWMTLFAGVAASALVPARSRAADGRKILRVALSASTTVGANPNDARAAYRVWLNSMSRAEKQASMAEPVSDVIIPSEQVLRDFHQGRLDGFGGTALEYADLIEDIDPTAVLLQNNYVDGIEYVLLVHTSSRFKKLADLRGGQILSHLHRDMVLLPTWLGVMLAADHLPAPEHFFGSYFSHDTVNQVLLPVYFGSADGAFVARRSWETAAELNPQMGRDLRPLAVSPKVIPLVFAFHRNCNPESRNALIEEMLRMGEETAGSQMNALFQASSFVVRPASVMKDSLEMVRQFERMPARQAR